MYFLIFFLLKINLQENILNLQLKDTWHKEVKLDLENETMEIPKYEGYYYHITIFKW